MGDTVREKKEQKRRAMGEIIMGKLMAEGTGIEGEVEGMIVGWIKQRKERWRIVGVYAKEGIEKVLNGLEQ